MLITINNKLFRCTDGDSVINILTAAGIDTSNIAVAIGNQIIPNSEWKSAKVSDGAKILVIKATYGG